MLLFFAFLGAGSSHAQDVSQPLPIEEPNAEYSKAIRFQGVQADVQYFDPNATAPDFITNEQPKTEREERAVRSNGGSGFSVPGILITAAVLLGVLFLFIRFGGAGSLVLRSDVSNPKRAQGKGRAGTENAPVDMASFDGIVANPDRQQALISMAQLLIYKAVSANDLLLQRSWTVRDVLRRIPRNSKYLPELSSLVLKGELVHFGERDVSEEEFADFAARAKPLLRELSV